MVRSIASTLLIILAVACHRKLTKTTALKTTYPAISTIYMDIAAAKSGVLRHLQELTDAVLQEQNRSGGRMEIARAGEMTLDMDGKRIYISVPVSLAVRSGLMAGTRGVLRVRFRTEYSIRPDWILESHTVVDRHEWPEPPRAHLAGLRIPIEKLADRAVGAIAPAIARRIDEQLMTAINGRRGEWLRAMEALGHPRMVDSTHRLYLWGKVRQVAWTPPRLEDDTLRTALTVRAEVYVGSSPPDTLRVDSLPLEETDAESATVIHINGSWDEAMLTRLAQEALCGRVFKTGGKTVRVESAKVAIAGRLLVTKLRLRGGFDGFFTLYAAPLSGLPGRIVASDDMDITLDGGRFWHRWGLRLAKGRIKMQLAEKINAQAESISRQMLENVKELTNSLSLGKNIQIVVLPDGRIIHNFETIPLRLRTVTTLSGKLKVSLK